MEKNLGHATAYGYAKSKGYSGTEDEFAQLMADYASVGQSAAQSAEQAAASAESASGSAATAASAAQTATTKASEAVTAAGTATTKASEASTSADTASAAATSASTSAQTATAKAGTATAKADEAAASEAAALSAKTDAETARDAAAQSASRAEQSAESIDPDEFNRKIYAAFATDTATGAIASFPDGADSIPMKDVLVHIEPVQEGSGDPSPDNVRPITGWTGAKVTRCGKNWAYLNPRELTTDGVTMISDGHGKITVTGTHTRAAWHGGYEHFTLPPGTYTITSLAEGTVSQAGDNTIASLGIAGYYLNIAQIGTVNKRTFTLTEPTEYGYSLWLPTGAFNLQLYAQIELGSTATDYEPYSGQTYDITFPTEAGTVYGGTLDVTTGELVVDRAGFTLTGNEGWYRANTLNSHWRFSIGDNQIATTCNRDAISNVYKSLTPAETYDGEMGVSQNSVNHNLCICDERYETVEDFKTYLATAGVFVSYTLTTPITYQLTPQEITSLLGTNNLWADTGDSDVEYRADTTMYISRLTEPDADMITDANIVSGQYFMVGNNLYRATSNIASGASVIVGTNAVKVSLATALNEINQ